MKFTLKFSKKKRDQSKRPRRARPVRNTSLEQAWLGIFGIAVIVLAGTAGYLYWEFGGARARAQAQNAERAVAGYAAQIEEMMRQYRTGMDFVVHDPEVVDLLQQRAERALREKEASFSYLFPDSLKIRFLPIGELKPDRSTSPPLGYACLDMLHEAQRSDTPPPAEVHMRGTPQQHIDLVRSITDPSGEVAGNLMVTLAVTVLQQSLGRLHLDGGYVELRQVTPKGNQLTLVSRGKRDSADGPAAHTRAIKGTRWKLTYQPPHSGAFGILEQLGYWGVFGAGLLVFGLASLMLYRAVSRALRDDQVTAIRLLKDFVDGRLERRYPARLKNCRGALEQLQHMARDSSAPGPGTATKAATSPADKQGEVLPELMPGADALEVRESVETSTVPTNIFRAYDIRGVVDETLTPEIVHEIGRAIGSEAHERGQQKVLVARDGRLSSPQLAEALIKGLTAAGRDVVDVGRVPTPVLYFATHYLGTGSGVMVTGSHNPANYNGLKIMLRGEALYEDDIQNLRHRIETGNLIDGEGSTQQVDVTPSYIDRVTSDVRLARPLNVVVDCGNGVAGELAPQLLRALGCEVVELYCEIDGTFPNHHPDPGRPENLIALTRAVMDQQADVGVAFDGDGDRLGVVDSGGKIIWPDRLLMLLAKDVLMRQPGAEIIYDVKSSRHLEELIRSLGGKPLMWKTGHSLIKAKMHETGALLAGEMSGHIFYKERWFGFDDALYACARLLEVVAGDDRPSAQLFSELPESVSTPELNVPTAEGQHFQIMQRLLADARFAGAKLITVDGLRVEFEDGWGLVRASNTTPSLVLRFEAKDAEALRRIQDELRAQLHAIEPSLELPF